MRELDSTSEPRPRLKQSVQEKNFVDAIRLSAVTGQLAYKRLCNSLLRYSSGVERESSSVEKADLLMALDDAWNVVNLANRIHRLVERFPTGNKKAPWRRSYLASTKHLPHFRNGIQHLESDLPDLTSTSERAWGTLHWRFNSSLESDTHRTFTFLHGSLGGDQVIHTDRWPRAERGVYGVGLRFRGQLLWIGPLNDAFLSIRRSLTAELSAADLGDPLHVDNTFHSDVAVREG